MSSQKIFCIGLNKTGTTSLHKAFEILGYNSVHYSSKEGNIQNIIANNYKDNQLLLKSLEHYDVILDWNDESILDLYKVFDQQYPNSKFILNTRDLGGWINSREKHVLNISDLENLQKKYPEHTWYNIDKAAWEKLYHQHHKSVKDYFKNRPNDILEFNLFEGDGWEKLCGFLNIDQPPVTFPYANKRQSAFKKRIKRVKIILKNILGLNK